MKVGRDIHFAVVPEWVIDAKISDAALRLYVVLGRYVDSHMTCYPSRTTIAKRMGRSVDTVDRAAKELVAVGALEIEARHNGKGRTSNLWTLKSVPPGVAADLRSTADGDQHGCGSPGREDAAHNESHSTTLLLETSTTSSNADGWEIGKQALAAIRSGVLNNEGEAA